MVQLSIHYTISETLYEILSLSFQDGNIVNLPLNSHLTLLLISYDSLSSTIFIDKSNLTLYISNSLGAKFGSGLSLSFLLILFLYLSLCNQYLCYLQIFFILKSQ